MRLNYKQIMKIVIVLNFVILLLFQTIDAHNIGFKNHSLRLLKHNQQQQLQQQQQQQQHKQQLSTTYSPVIFIPGDGGSQLEARLNKTSRVHYICDLETDWYDIWLNIHLLAPYVFDCLVDNLKLTYDNKTHTTNNTAGVDIRATKFGSLDSVEYLDIFRVTKTDYFYNIISTLEKNNGLVRNVDMIGASFDFRKAPNELEEFFQNLTNLIQDHYIRNNYRPVTLICHSMGCLNAVYLLNRKSQNWKDVFIKRLITLAAPWGGSFKAISAMMFGDNLGIPLLNKEKLQSLQSTFPSLMYLFPRPPTFNADRILVQTPTNNYTSRNLDDMFIEIGLLDQMNMWHDTRSIAASLTAPNVEMWCLYGSDIPTPSKIVFDGPLDLSKNSYHELEDDGDGTVNLESLRACAEFRKQGKPFYTRMFSKIDHIDILRGNEAANFISSHIMEEDLIST